MPINNENKQNIMLVKMWAGLFIKCQWGNDACIYDIVVRVLVINEQIQITFQPKQTLLQCWSILYTTPNWCKGC